MEKNTKWLKKASGEINLSTTGALEEIIQTDSESYSAGLQILYFRQLVM